MDEWKIRIDRLSRGMIPSEEELSFLLKADREEAQPLFEAASELRQKIFGDRIYIRGLIEFTNYCKNDCYYCGIRKSNLHVQRYRLDADDILHCCAEGYALGFRTFVLQGGEDFFFSDEKIVRLVDAIKSRYPDCAVTLSIGEKPRESYQAYFDAGADRYLLRQETASPAHYRKLHPPSLSPENRKRCLYDLKEIGYQVGCGLMVGSPFQTAADIWADLCFMKELQPQMIGVGPFLPHRDTPFAQEAMGTLEQTLVLLSILRLLFPRVLLPATTALATVSPNGREQGILAGANVVMPNLSPLSVRKKYLLYDDKAGTGAEAAEGLSELKERLTAIGCQIAVDRGDYPADI